MSQAFFQLRKIGLDLTSQQRDDLSTMLISIIDPNAEIRDLLACLRQSQPIPN